MDHCGLIGSTPTGECRLLQVPPLTHCLSVCLSSNFSFNRLQSNNRQGCICVIIRRRRWTNAPWGGLEWTWRVKEETSREWVSSQTHETPPSPAERPLLFGASFSPAKGEKVTDRGLCAWSWGLPLPKNAQIPLVTHCQWGPWGNGRRGLDEDPGEKSFRIRNITNSRVNHMETDKKCQGRIWNHRTFKSN